MKIVELYAENVKRLKIVQVKTDGKNVVILGGENEQGKSSVLDCIEMAIGGAGHVPGVPIHAGATSGKIKLDLGELKIERTFSASKGTALVVTGADGKKIGSPQAVLDKLYSTIAFDPLAFASQKPTDQAATLRKIVGLDFSELDVKRAKIYSEREEHGRALAQGKARLAAMPAPDADLPAEEMSVSKLMAEKEAADAGNRANADVRKNHENAMARTQDKANAVEIIKRDLAAAEAEYAAAKQSENSKQDVVAGLSADVDTTPIVAKIKGAEDINRSIRARDERARVSEVVAAGEAERARYTAALESIDAEKSAKLATVTWPIDGLGFSADGVTYQGLPFEQAGASARLRTSVAIGCAQYPQLRVMLVRDASLLGKNGMATLAEMADKEDMQLWIERVGDGDVGAIILEDGAVKS